jgi:dihydrolipoamide dehydrogenase
MSSSTQLVVIGAGPGGYAAAFYAADLGMQVTLIDPSPNPGGVCLYRGCIPSKALLHVAKLLGEAKHAEAWGITFGEPKIDLDRLRGFKEKVVNQLTGGLGQLSKQRKVTYVQGKAHPSRDAKTLEIDGTDGTQTLKFEHAIIATGSHPAKVPGCRSKSDRVMDSTGALDLPDIPKSLLVVGGGYIGLELGSVYAALGTKVTVVEMTDGLLPGADRDLVNILAKRIESICEAVLLNTKVVGMKDGKGGITVTLEGDVDPKERTFDRVLVSVGRRPNPVPGIETRACGEPARLHRGGREAAAPPSRHLRHRRRRRRADAGAQGLARGADGGRGDRGQKAAFEPLAIPAVVFTDPELAWCGLTEGDAKKRNREVTSRASRGRPRAVRSRSTAPTA